MTPTVCLRGSGGRPGETTGRRRRHPRKQHVIWARGAGAPGEDRCPGGGATPHSPKGALAHRLFPQVGGISEVGTGPAGAGTGGTAGTAASAPSLPARRGWRLGSEAAGGHFSCGAAKGPGGPPPHRLPLPPPPGPLPAPGRARPRGSACRRPALGGGGTGGRRACGRRVGGIRAEGRAGGEEGEGGEPLPILGRSRRRRRPAVGESKVVAGRHFGIFPQPAGHCDGHGESGPMAGGEARRGRDAEGGKGRERERLREKPPSPGRAAAAPPPPPASHSLTHSHARVAAAASSPEPAPTPRASPPPRAGEGATRGPRRGTLYSP